jgi:hypothetical protein
MTPEPVAHICMESICGRLSDISLLPQPRNSGWVGDCIFLLHQLANINKQSYYGDRQRTSTYVNLKTSLEAGSASIDFSSYPILIITRHAGYFSPVFYDQRRP